MKSWLIPLVIFLIPLLASCGPKTVSGLCPDNLEPMYGGERSEACQAQDQDFLQRMDDSGRGRAELSASMARQGFDSLENGDTRTAMQRFNRAWLLDPENCMAFSGFAAVKFTRDGDARYADELYETALGLCPAEPGVTSGFGLLLERAGRCEKAISLLEQSLSENDSDVEVWKALLRCHIREGDPAVALRTARRMQARSIPVDLKLVRELERRVEQAR